MWSTNLYTCSKPEGHYSSFERLIVPILSFQYDPEAVFRCRGRTGRDCPRRFENKPSKRQYHGVLIRLQLQHGMFLGRLQPITCPLTDSPPQIQKAVSSISTSSKDEHSIFIYSGTYTEQVTIPVLSGKLNIYGYTTNTADYSGNVVNLQWKSALATGAADDEHTAALINTSPNVAVYNINIKNTYGKPSGSNGQAIALSAYNTEQGYYGVGL